mmetsp:Transcript_14549/g.34564  ORF Transcript_14549/g.34564 Transcript_14549/m.34564 type:complete len:284 (+) Transcript_14549:988-1839(+)
MVPQGPPPADQRPPRPPAAAPLRRGGRLPPRGRPAGPATPPPLYPLPFLLPHPPPVCPSSAPPRRQWALLSRWFFTPSPPPSLPTPTRRTATLSLSPLAHPKPPPPPPLGKAVPSRPSAGAGRGNGRGASFLDVVDAPEDPADGPVAAHDQHPQVAQVGEEPQGLHGVLARELDDLKRVEHAEEPPPEPRPHLRAALGVDKDEEGPVPGAESGDAVLGLWRAEHHVLPQRPAPVEALEELVRLLARLPPSLLPGVDGAGRPAGARGLRRRGRFLPGLLEARPR